MSDAQHARDEAREASHVAEEEAQKLREAVRVLEAAVASERKVVEDLRAEAELSKDAQGRLRTKVGALEIELLSRNEFCKKMEDEVVQPRQSQSDTAT